MNKPVSTKKPRFARMLLVQGSIVMFCAAAIAASYRTTDTANHESPECASLARIEVSRSHSLLEGAITRAAIHQSYLVCERDPAAFRRMVR